MLLTVRSEEMYDEVSFRHCSLLVRGNSSPQLSVSLIPEMHPTLRICSERVHRPLIHFLGKRSWPTSAYIYQNIYESALIQA